MYYLNVYILGMAIKLILAGTCPPLLDFDGENSS
jgi:hypothetical protein